MGVRLPRSINDYAKFKLDFGVQCRACGRTAVYDPRDAILFFARRKWSTALPLTQAKFRCACGSRETDAIAVPTAVRPDPLPERMEPLLPLYVRGS